MFKFLTQFFYKPEGILVDFSNKVTYDIACALRGPDHTDHCASVVKWVLTARLRALVGLPNTSFGDVRSIQLTADTAQSFLRVAQSPSPPSWIHYAGHLATAFDHLNQPELARVADCLTAHNITGLTYTDIIELAGGDPE